MTKKLVLFISPLILLLELQLLSWITALLRQASDQAVAFGMLLLCFGVLGNYYLVKFIVNQSKQTIK